MTHTTDTNQASEDESKKPSERKRLFDRLIFMFGWRGETRRNKANKMMKIIDQYTETIIRTEKLKLLAEVRELIKAGGYEASYEISMIEKLEAEL